MGKYEGFTVTGGGAAEPPVIEPQVIRAEGDTVTIPDAHLLFSGDFSRSGADLVIAGEERSVVVADYFGDAGTPTLAAPNGAVLLPDVVSALAGPLAPGQYAQADDAQPAAGIGSVVTLTGSATAQRSDGTIVDLTVDSRLTAGDVVQTASGSALGIVFDDGAVFTLNADSRMVLNELVYEPGGSSNSMLFSLVQGVFAFVAGQVAPTGEMRIDTPVASMGIRGTSGIVKLETIDGVAVFRVIPDPVTNNVGTIVLYVPGTDIILVVMDSSDVQWAIDPATGQVIEQPADPGDADLIQRLHQTYIEFAGIVDDPGDTQFAQTNGSGLATLFSLTPAEIAAIVALAGGAFPQIEPLAGDPVSSGLDFRYEPEGVEFDPAPPPPPLPEPGSSDPQHIPPGGFTGDDFGSVEEDGTLTTTGQLVFGGGTGLIQPLVIQGTYGTFVIDADGNWVYTLDNESDAVQSLGEGVTAEETFAVVSADGSETQFVTIRVQGVNDVPEVTGTTTGDVVEDGTQVATGTVTVDDPDTGESSVQPLSDVAGTYGTFSIDADGNWTYVLDNDDPAVQALAEGQTVTDSFTVTSFDGTATETVTITVTGTNDAPATQDDEFATNEDTTVNGNVLADNGNGPDDDIDGDPLTVTHVNGSTANVGTQIVLASGALLLLNADGSFAYDPNGQFDLGSGDSAQDSFTYTVADGQGGSDTATVTLTITGVNDPPVATDSLIATNEGVAAAGMLTGMDVDSDTVIFSLEQGPQNGTVVINADGSYVYTPDEGVTGQDSFTFRVTDGQGAFDIATVEIDIAEVGELAQSKEIVGTAGNDVLIGSALNDVLFGGAGNDVLRSGGAPQNFFGLDLLDGGPGDDTLIAEGGGVILVGGLGNDVLQSVDSGEYYDWVRAEYGTSPNGIVANLTGSFINDLAPGEVADGFGTIDLLSRMHVLADSPHDDVIHVDGSYQSSFGNFIEVRLSGGDDTVVFDNVAHARIGYNHAGGAVLADLEPARRRISIPATTSSAATPSSARFMCCAGRNSMTSSSARAATTRSAARAATTISTGAAAPTPFSSSVLPKASMSTCRRIWCSTTATGSNRWAATASTRSTTSTM
jgi:VCBS repeat-containing protein